MSASEGDSKTSARVENPVFGGDCLARTLAGETFTIPFVLPGEWVKISAQRAEPGKGAETAAVLPEIQVSSPDRAEPRCLHFGRCGGCQYQMAAYPAQLAIKETILRETLGEAKVGPLPEIQRLASPEPYGYRNRIRLRVRTAGGEVRLGYSVRGSQEFLPIRMCPIAAPLLWRAAESVLAVATEQRELRRMLEFSTELELFASGDDTSLQITLLSPTRERVDAGALEKAILPLHRALPQLKNAAAVRFDPRSGRPLEVLASWGTAGVAYAVLDETYWISRGGFFQVNRFLLPQLTELVCRDRDPGGPHLLAWDLFAGVGLFSRVLARQYRAITAVEANPVAAADLGRALAKLGRGHRAVEATTADFLRRAVLQRDRPELVVLDPPRAGAGEEVCRLLARLSPLRIVYLSCDPTTLARDLAVLTGSGYSVTELHLIDLFPQTYHLETLTVLRRTVSD